MEQRKPVPDFEGIYEVSNLGQIKRVKAANGTTPGKILKVDVDKNGYHVVRLSKDKKMWARKVHRLVALVFIPNPLVLPEVNHKDGKKDRNVSDNLEWQTNLGNIQHACINGFRALGENAPGAKLTKLQVIEIRKRYVRYNKCRGNGKVLAKEFGVTGSQISRIVKGKCWNETSNTG